MAAKRTWAIRTILLLILACALLMGGMLSGKRPTNLGVTNGNLLPCPNKPNCVSTQADNESQAIEPLAFEGTADSMAGRVRETLSSWPRTEIVSDVDGYFHAECTSAICRYVDDLEVWVDGEKRLVHARSASRLGYSDLGVNRKRVEKLFTALRERR